MEKNRFTRRSFLALTTGALAAAKAIGKPKPVENEQPVKKVLLIGDYIKTSYHKRLEALMGTRAQILTPADNCGNSVDILSQMEKWLKQYDPDVILINVGFEDIRTIYYGSYDNLVPTRHYTRNVKLILDFVYLFSTKAVPLWVTTTFVNDEKHVAAKATVRDYTIFNDDVLEYNRIAMKLCRRQKVSIVDVFNVMSYSSPESLVEADGYRLNAKGVETVAKQIASQVENYL